jgi:hypothetical protein
MNGADMKMLTRAIVRTIGAGAVCLSVMTASPAAFAADAASIAAAKQVLTVTGATTMFRPLIAGVVEQARLLYLQQNPGLGKDLNDVATKMRADLEPRFSELVDEMAKMYGDAFTEKELKDILAFYESPTGKKLLDKQPKLVDSSMGYARDWANKLSEEVTAKMREELMKRGHKM